MAKANRGAKPAAPKKKAAKKKATTKRDNEGGKRSTTDQEKELQAWERGESVECAPDETEYDDELT